MLQNFGIVGHKGCGKRSFIEYAINGKFEPSIPENPTGFGRAGRSSFQVPVVLENGSKESISIEPRDDATDLSIALARLNPFKRSYIVCFDITNRSSWEYITRQASALGPHYAGIVVGMKADLESDRKVSKEEAEELCNAHNGKYFECSAKTGQNIHEALTELVRVARPEGAPQFTWPGKRKEARSDDEHRCICM